MITETEIKTMLDELANYQAGRDAIAMAKQAAIDAIMTPEIRQQLTDIDAEFVKKSVVVEEKIADLSDSIRIQVGALGQSVKGQFLHAVWNQGRKTWDSKWLAGYANDHPEILTACKVGEPSVAIRAAK